MSPRKTLFAFRRHIGAVHFNRFQTDIHFPGDPLVDAVIANRHAGSGKPFFRVRGEKLA